MYLGDERASGILLIEIPYTRDLKLKKLVHDALSAKFSEQHIAYLTEQ